MRLCKRSVDLIKTKKTYYYKNEISSVLYSMGRCRNHFGKANIEHYLINSYSLEPLIDPDIRQIRFNFSENNQNDLIAYIYVRFAHDLIYFPFEGKRVLNSKSIKKAEELNKKLPPYLIKSDYNENFYIDLKRKSPIHPSKDKNSVEKYLRELFNSSQFKRKINSIYDNNVYDWAKEYSKKTHFYPLRHGYGLFAVVKTLDYLSINEKFFNKKKL